MNCIVLMVVKHQEHQEHQGEEGEEGEVSVEDSTSLSGHFKIRGGPRRRFFL